MYVWIVWIIELFVYNMYEIYGSLDCLFIRMIVINYSIVYLYVWLLLIIPLFI